MPESHVCTGLGSPLPTSAPGLGPHLPHLHRDWAHPTPHLDWDWARPCRICAGTALAPATSAPGLVPPLPTSAWGLDIECALEDGGPASPPAAAARAAPRRAVRRTSRAFAPRRPCLRGRDIRRYTCNEGQPEATGTKRKRRRLCDTWSVRRMRSRARAGVLKGDPRGTQGVHKGYSRGTQGVLKGYSRGTQGVHEGTHIGYSRALVPAAAVGSLASSAPQVCRSARAWGRCMRAVSTNGVSPVPVQMWSG